jgi:hypothetical protein
MAEKKKEMSVREAGHKGGEKKAGTHGKEFYHEIGHKGGEKVRELVKKARKQKSKTLAACSRQASWIA